MHLNIIYKFYHSILLFSILRVNNLVHLRIEKIIIRYFLHSRFDGLQDDVLRRNEVNLVIEMVLQRVNVVVAGQVGENCLETVPQDRFIRNALDLLLNQILNLWQLAEDLGDVSLDSWHCRDQHLELVLHHIPGYFISLTQLR